jgi:hypothetical protein
LGRRRQLSPSVVTDEDGGEEGRPKAAGLYPVLAARTAVPWPHEAETLLAAWLRRACCAAVVLRSEFGGGVGFVFCIFLMRNRVEFM